MDPTWAKADRIVAFMDSMWRQHDRFVSDYRRIRWRLMALRAVREPQPAPRDDEGAAT